MRCSNPFSERKLSGCRIQFHCKILKNRPTTTTAAWLTIACCPNRGIVGPVPQVRLVTVLTMFCFPTALALVISGSIIYLNEDVTLAFRIGDAGFTNDQILQTFSARPGS